MTENATQTVETDAVNGSDGTAEKVTVSPEVIASIEAYAPFWEMYRTVADEANSLSKSYKAATESATTVVDTLLTESDDEDLAKWREFDAKIAEKINALVKQREDAHESAKKHAVTLAPAVADVDLDKVKADYLVKRQAANLTGKNIKALLGNDEALFKAGLEHYGITEVIGLSRNSQTVGATGIIRKKIASATIDGENYADANGKVSFTSLATKMKVDGAVIRDAAAKSAGVDTVKDIPNGTTVSFTIVSGDKSHSVTVTTPESDD